MSTTTTTAEKKYHRVALGDVTPNNLGQLRRLNSVLFPVHYNDQFYKEVLEVGEYAKLAYFNDIPVGAICCRFDSSQSSKLYVLTLGVLAPYRRLGIASQLLKHVLDIATNPDLKDSATPSQKVESLYAHVQVGNEEALALYSKHGFTQHTDIVKEYYKPNVQPRDAHLVEKIL